MTRRTLFVSAYLMSLTTGLAQLLLAWRGHVLEDFTWTRPVDHAQVPWFGYLSTFFWWVPYVTSVPIMMASSVQGLSAITSLLRFARFRKATLFLACVAGFGLSCFIVGHELLRAFKVEPNEWAQWNDLLAKPLAPTLLPHYRLALLLLAYAHYFAAYAACTASVIAALLVTSRLQLTGSLSDRTAVSRTLSELLLSVKIVVGGWLFYLVLLRSSKVHMWLVYRNQPPALGRIYDFLSTARPYFEASREGVFTNILFGLLWSGVCFAIHYLSVPILRTSNQAQPTTIEAALQRGRAGYELIGPLWTGFLGLCILGIVLPPPSGLHFLAVVGVIVGGFLVRRSFRTAQ